MNAVPKLRFSEFSSSFSKVKFDEVFSFSSGKSIKQAEASPNFKVPCVRYGELYHMYGEVITKTINFTNLDRSELKFSEGDEILLPSAGEDPLDIGSASALKVKGVAIGRTINVLRPLRNGVYEPVYMSYLINQVLRSQIAALAKGVSISNVYNSDLKSLSATIPSLPEQQKIASFLSSLDKKIDLLRQKKDALELYKKGLMQKIFSQKIRFKQDDGRDFPDWEEVALGEIVDRVKRKNTSVNTNVLTISAQMGLVSQLDYFNKSVSSANLSGYTLLQNGDFAYNKSYSNGYPVGAIKRQIRYDFGVVSPLYICFRPHDHDIGNYLEIYLDSYFVVQDISKIMQEGARNHGLINISVSDFFDFVSIPLPCSDERQKITSYFDALDAKLKIASSQVEQMETFKKGLLQQMFV